MGKLGAKVSRVLKEYFAGARVDLRAGESEAVGGFVVWDGFNGLPDRERVRRVDRALKKELGKDEYRGVSVIAPFTPAEMVAWREEMARPQSRPVSAGSKRMVGS